MGWVDPEGNPYFFEIVWPETRPDDDWVDRFSLIDPALPALMYYVEVGIVNHFQPRPRTHVKQKARMYFCTGCTGPEL